MSLLVNFVLFFCAMCHFILLLGVYVIKKQVVKGKVEEVELPEKADILISEPMGKPFHVFTF